MESIAKRIEPCPEEIQEEVKTPIAPKEFFDALEEWVKGAVRMVIEKAIAFYSFPYRHWEKIRTTNTIERAFREFR